MNLNIIIETSNNPLLFKTSINNPIFVDKSYEKNKTITIYINKKFFEKSSNTIIQYINKYLSSNTYETLSLDSNFIKEETIKNLELSNIKILELKKDNKSYILDNKIYKYLENVPKIYVNEVSSDLKDKKNLYHNGIVTLENNLFNYNFSYKNLKERNYIILSKPLDKNNLKDLKKIFDINPNITEISFSFNDINEYIKSIDNILTLTNNSLKFNFKSNIGDNNIEIFKNIKEKYKNKNINFEISYTKELNAKHNIENDNVCTLDEYINMEEILNVYVDSIKKHNYSPFEQILCAYDIVKSYEYIKENYDEDPLLSRQLHTSINGKKIVCVGYASIFSAILSKLNIPCSTYGTFIFDNNDFEGHERNILYLKDDKYKIDGIFICDPTWDRRRDDNSEALDKYTYFMINPFDIPNFEMKEDINGVSIINLFGKQVKYDYNSTVDFINMYDKLFNTCYSDESDINKYIENFLNKSNKRITYGQLLKAIINVRKNEGIYNSYDELKENINKLVEVNKKREKEEYKQKSEIISRKNKKVIELDNKQKIYRFNKKHF